MPVAVPTVPLPQQPVAGPVSEVVIVIVVVGIVWVTVHVGLTAEAAQVVVIVGSCEGRHCE